MAADYPLGVARGQLHATYIVAQTEDGIVIVDQHAAHERLVYEHMKAALAHGGVARQILLLPEVVELEEAAAARLTARSEELSLLGLVLEGFGPGAVIVRETPALLGEGDVKGLVRDLAEELAEFGDSVALQEKLSEVCSSMACHGGGDERAPPRDGGDAPFRPVQSRPPDLCRAQARRYRAPIRPALI